MDLCSHVPKTVKIAYGVYWLETAWLHQSVPELVYGASIYKFDTFLGFCPDSPLNVEGNKEQGGDGKEGTKGKDRSMRKGSEIGSRRGRRKRWEKREGFGPTNNFYAALLSQTAPKRFLL